MIGVHAKVSVDIERNRRFDGLIPSQATELAEHIRGVSEIALLLALLK